MKEIIVQRIEGQKISDEAEWLKLSDVKASINVQTGKKNEYRRVFYTDNGEYIYCISNDAVLKLLHKHEGLVTIDRGRLANLYHVEHIDYDNSKVFFDVKKNDYMILGEARKGVVKEYFKKLFGLK